MAAFPRLLGVFYAEFDVVLGPRIAAQSPDGVVSPDAFDAMSEFLIPKPQLCGRLLTLCTEKEKVMSMPVIIESNRYERNALIFNVGFVFAIADDTTCYEPVVRKVAKTLRTLELERQFLSTDGKQRLESILPDMVDDLNRYHEFQTNVGSPAGDPVAFNLKLFPAYEEPLPILDHEVPVLTTPLQEHVTPEWDLTTRRILPHVDGVNFVRRIAAVSDIDIHLVRECLQNLRYYGAIHMVDIFQFANSYALTDAIHRLYTDESLQRECAHYVRLDEKRALPGTHVLFAAYACFRHGSSVATIASDGRLAAVNIDVRHLVTFGVVRGVLRRVHLYAVRAAPAVLALPGAVAPPDTPMTPGFVATMESPMRSREDAATTLQRRLRRLTVQPRSFDELCVVLSIGMGELETALDADADIQVHAR